MPLTTKGRDAPQHAARLSVSDRDAIKRAVCDAVANGFVGSPLPVAKGLVQAFRFIEAENCPPRLPTSPAT